jgi:hypothetical protein
MKRCILLLICMGMPHIPTRATVFTAATQAGNSSQDATIQLTARILTRKDRSDNSLGVLDLKLGLRLTNTSRQPVILRKDCIVIYKYMLSRDLLTAAKSEYEAHGSFRFIPKEDPPVNTLEFPEGENKQFILLEPGAHLDVEREIQVLFSLRKGKSNRALGTERILQVKVMTWYFSQKLAEELGERWKGRGLLWTKSVTSLPIDLKLDEKGQ